MACQTQHIDWSVTSPYNNNFTHHSHRFYATTSTTTTTTTTTVDGTAKCKKNDKNTITNPSQASFELQQAASEGRTAVELVNQTTLNQNNNNNNKQNRSTTATAAAEAELDKNPNHHHLHHQDDKEYHHRQSLIKATKSLLDATKATGLLAESIAEIKGNDNNDNHHHNKAAAKCLQELHKAFLSLTQSLLNCLEPTVTFDYYLKNNDETASTTAISSSRPPKQYSKKKRKDGTTPRRRGRRRGRREDDDDNELVELLLAVTYRSHQLSLPFHWPLYQRLALTLAKQPHLTTLRSRAEWIWNIHEMSQNTWGCCTTSNEQQLENINDHDDDDTGNGKIDTPAYAADIDWFRPTLLTLANGKHWSDLSYLLRCLLQPPLVLSNPARRRKNRSINGSIGNKNRNKYILMDYMETNNLLLRNEFYLDESTVRGILVEISRDQTLSELWKHLQRPSPMEEDILDVLLLLENSIWKVFEHDADAAAQAASMYARKKEDRSCSHAKNHDDDDDGGTPKASLRDAIEVLLQTTPRSNIYSNSVSDDDRNDEMSGDEDDLGQILHELEEILLDQGEDLDDEEGDDHGQFTSDAFTIATILLDSRNPNRNDTMTQGRDRHHFLEISGLTKSSYPSSSYTWDEEDEFCAADFVYTREPGYNDHIPDIAAEVYQLNGNKPLRYSAQLEDEIYQRFRRPNTGYYDEEEYNDVDI
jgi:hypothetical protein